MLSRIPSITFSYETNKQCSLRHSLLAKNLAHLLTSAQEHAEDKAKAEGDHMRNHDDKRKQEEEQTSTHNGVRVILNLTVIPSYEISTALWER